MGDSTGRRPCVIAACDRFLQGRSDDSSTDSDRLACMNHTPPSPAKGKEAFQCRGLECPARNVSRETIEARPCNFRERHSELSASEPRQSTSAVSSPKAAGSLSSGRTALRPAFRSRVSRRLPPCRRGRESLTRARQPGVAPNPRFRSNPQCDNPRRERWATPESPPARKPPSCDSPQPRSPTPGDGAQRRECLESRDRTRHPPASQLPATPCAEKVILRNAV